MYRVGIPCIPYVREVITAQAADARARFESYEHPEDVITIASEQSGIFAVYGPRVERSNDDRTV